MIHVLKNVARVERFIQDVIRECIVEELVFLSFHTLILEMSHSGYAGMYPIVRGWIIYSCTRPAVVVCCETLRLTPCRRADPDHR